MCSFRLAQQSLLARLQRAKKRRHLEHLHNPVTVAPHQRLAAIGPVTTVPVREEVDSSSDEAATYFHKSLQQCFVSRSALYAAVIAKESPRYQLTVARKHGGRSFKGEQKIVCSAGNSCTFFVCTRGEPNTDGSWHVTSFCATHTCTAEERVRQRTYGTAVLTHILGAEGLATRSTAADIQGALKLQGFKMGPGTAHKLVREKEGLNFHSLLLDFHIAPEFFAHCQELDPHGIYLLEEQETLYSAHTFRRCFMAESVYRRLLAASGATALLAVIDGGHMKIPFGGVLLIACMLDANNEAVVLASGIVQAETAEDCAWFAECFYAAHPSVKLVMQDEGTGLNSNLVRAVFGEPSEFVKGEAQKLGCALSSSVRVINCARHMEKPVQLSVGRMKGVGAAVLAAAGSRTEDWLAKVLAKMPLSLREVLAPRLDAVSVCRRLKDGLPTDGVITNQPAESMLSTLSSARQHGPTLCMLKLHQVIISTVVMKCI